MQEINKKFGKYANLEIERKFLLAELPAEAVLYSEIEDFYIVDTTLRLRKAKTKNETKYKLAQKLRPDPKSTRLILHTNIYISESEFKLLSALPNNQLEKNRFELNIEGTNIWIDQFKAELDGLIIAEVDFGASGDPEAFLPPSFFLKEVTDDEKFTGANLARTDSIALKQILK